jgi:hypothetical protein
VVKSTCEQLNVTDEDGEWNSFDYCSGHMNENREYHYHFPPSCLLAKMDNFSDGHSPQIGWALDGFPIYGPYGPSGTAMRGCDNNGAGSPCLDSCGGYEAELADVDNFKYRYYFAGTTSDLTTLPATPRPTWDDFPFILKCYRGCTVENMDSKKKCKNAEAGYTDSYTPVANAGFTEVATFENDLTCSCADMCHTATSEDRCNWGRCSGCYFCSTTTTTTTSSTTVSCESWCEASTDDDKCSWNKCSGCDFC